MQNGWANQIFAGRMLDIEVSVATVGSIIDVAVNRHNKRLFQIWYNP